MITNTELAIGSGLIDEDLRQLPYSQYGSDLSRRTLTRAMRLLISQMQADKVFSGVTFSEEYPEAVEKAPWVVWCLENRVPGVEGKQRLQQSMDEEYYTEQNEILQKYIQPHTFIVSLSVLETKNTDANNLMDALELWIMNNPQAPYIAGIDTFVFNQEQKRDEFECGGSQKLKRRRIFYEGIIRMVYPRISPVINSVKIQNVNSAVKAQTVELTRTSGTDYDTVPVTGPCVVICLHNVSDVILTDYLYGVDFELVVDKDKIKDRFVIRWLRRGKRPVSNDSYYISFYYSEVQATVVPTANISKRRSNSTRNNRSRILGMPVPTGELPPSGDQYVDAGTSSSLQEALVKANTFVVAMLDQKCLPGLMGSAFQSPSES